MEIFQFVSLLALKRYTSFLEVEISRPSSASLAISLLRL
jgi:hypothetical protein